MANAIEYVDLPEPTAPPEEPPMRTLPSLPASREDTYVGTVRARQLATIGPIDLDVRYNSAAKEIIVGPFAFQLFEILLLMDNIKEGMDNILLDHQSARHCLGRKL